jgi:hypothetical protein
VDHASAVTSSWVVSTHSSSPIVFDRALEHDPDDVFGPAGSARLIESCRNISHRDSWNRVQELQRLPSRRRRSHLDSKRWPLSSIRVSAVAGRFLRISTVLNE